SGSRNAKRGCMSKVRVYEVAKQLNMDQKTLVALFQSMGIGDVRNHMSAVEVDVVERVKRYLERQKSPEVVEERIRPTVVKRRARAPETEPSTPSARPPAPEHYSRIDPAGRHAPDSIPRPPPSTARAPTHPPSSRSGLDVSETPSRPRAPGVEAPRSSR